MLIMEMPRRFRVLGWLPFMAAMAWAQQPQGPVELIESKTTYNITSAKGLPLSDSINNPPGSDGRAPRPGTQVPPLPPSQANAGQFQSAVFVGAGVRPVASLLDSSKSMVSNAVALDLPRLGGAKPTHVLMRAKVGHAVLSRQVNLLFGAVMEVPSVDEYGVMLPPGIRKEDYWYPEPYTTNQHAGSGYYWSPNARTVFATSAGLVEVTWRRMLGSVTPPGPASGTRVGIFTGGDPGEGLDTVGEFAYALNLGGVAPGNIGDANFGAGTTGTPAAGVTVAPVQGATRTSPNLGNTAADTRLSSVLGTVMAGSSTNRKVTVDLAVQAGQRYRLQLLFAEPPESKKGFNVLVGGSVVVPNLVPGSYLQGFTTNLATKGGGVVVSHAFVASAGTVRVELDGAGVTSAAITDKSPALCGLTLERLTDAADTSTPYAVQTSGFWYAAVKQRLVVSASMVKPSKPFYWTQGEFQKTGKPVLVPGNRVGDIKVVYNEQIPERVEKEHQSSSLITVTNAIPETRTLWFDKTTSQILSYNREGRVFVELLGDVKADGTRFHLGYEIVDVLRQPTPQDVRVDIGDKIRPFANPARDATGLYPEVVQAIGPQFVESAPTGNDSPMTMYAIRETLNLNDLQVFWMEVGDQGLRWPRTLSRYEVRWPADSARYSHYVRPWVATEDEAVLTAVRLEQKNIPVLLYQDPLDQERAKLTVDLLFYTYLTPRQPAHRSLLRYSTDKGPVFERVFSWLDANLKATNWAGTMATNLTAWNPTNRTMVFANLMAGPRVVSQVAYVGDRIQAPEGEIGFRKDEDYLAGHIRFDAGTSYMPGAYKDPLLAGFNEANKGSIIPVNAIPGRNRLEVWWFRKDPVQRGIGIEPISWPACIGRYELAYPANPREIVLASNAGTGGLESLKAKGSIYYQNDRTQHGYNPNEEHAMMIGGQGYALRDDLNIVSGPSFSSQPFVLIGYFDSDGRPSMEAFRVLREKASAGWLFDYVTDAGMILQAPMPLPLMPAPTEGEGVNLVNYNVEVQSSLANYPEGWQASESDGPLGHYKRFTMRDRKQSFWVYRGQHTEPDLAAGTYVASSASFVAMPKAVAVTGREFTNYLHASKRAGGLVLREADGTILPRWLKIDSDAEGIYLSGIPDATSPTRTYTLLLTDVGTEQKVEVPFVLEVLASGADVSQKPLRLTRTLADGSVVEYRGRPPFLAATPSGANSLTMRFYYKTQEGFDWPAGQVVPTGTIVPYLRPVGTLPGTYVGSAASKETPSLGIVYRPTWPVLPPVMRAGQTLTTPVAGLPDLRSQTSAEVVYQQSLATNATRTRETVVLIDPTRKKYSDLQAAGLEELPPGVIAEAFQGLFYFPNLPPHLSSRVYFDPAVGEKGSLVLEGEYAGEPAVGQYLRLNVLRGLETRDDLRSVLDLCPGAPAEDKSKWDALVNGLATKVETFMENPFIPGQFIPDPEREVTVGLGAMAEVRDDDTAVDSYAMAATGPGYGYVTLLVGNGRAFTDAGEPVSMHVFRVSGPLWPGELRVVPSLNPLNELLTLEHTPDLAGRHGEYEYEWKIAAPVDGAAPSTRDMSKWQDLQKGTGLPRFTLGGAGIQVLSDNYLIMRYRSVNTADPVIGQWSSWTEPQLAEGWVKRVLAGINPFQQRVRDLYNNPVNTDVSVLTQAGKKWEGAIALNLKNINRFGLIEIYETVARRAKDLSINAGINYGPANDALLLVAGYLNDLYTLLGNEASADAADPTISTSTAGGAQNSVATSRFSFAGQMGSLLEEELGLLRGRDDFMAPGVQASPAYNRLWWNYTRGIAAGEVTYAENYNIKDLNLDGNVDASDAAIAYPQGHGDAYGHHLTALKGYFSLLLNRNFDWVPRSEAVLVLGKPVSVDYADERKFAGAAGALAQVGVDVLKLVFRQAFTAEEGAGWDRFGATRANTNRVVATVRHWGLDHWATRVGVGSYVNWMVGNSMLPEVDPDPAHEGIQKIDRTTVPELGQLPVSHEEVQRLLDNAEAGVTPLGLSLGSIAFDLDPNKVVGAGSSTHFEQVYERAVRSLGNAAAAYADATRMSTDLASETDSIEKERELIVDTERAMTTRLIEIYGTPYTDDLGPGKTYPQDYEGPDLLHYLYVDMPEYKFPVMDPTIPNSFDVRVVDVPVAYAESLNGKFFQDWGDGDGPLQQFVDEFKFPVITNLVLTITPEGYTPRPPAWTGRRRSPGKVQAAVSALITAHTRLVQGWDDMSGAAGEWSKNLSLFKANWETYEEIRGYQEDLLISKQTLDAVLFANSLFEIWTEDAKETVGNVSKVIEEAVPDSTIVGVAAGGDITSPVRSALVAVETTSTEVLNKLKAARLTVVKSLEFATTSAGDWILNDQIVPREKRMELRQSLIALSEEMNRLHYMLWDINLRKRALYDAEMALRSLVAEGERVQAERLAFRRRAAAMVQGYRTRDVAYRLFRNEKLDRYRTLMDLASQYALLAANAYDYETGLLGTKTGRDFVSRIIQARAIGVIKDGVPQFTGSRVGDAGLSGALAELQADWSVLRGRLGFNNPDAYGTTTSLRTGNFRVLPGVDGDAAWLEVLQRSRRANIHDDVDVRRMCLGLGKADALPEPGIVMEFSTVIEKGLNLFGQPLAAGDPAFSSSSFATKVFAMGVALEGYKGMDTPGFNIGTVNGAGGVTPPDPGSSFMDVNAMASTPYIYLIPVGLDSMRSPPLGDQGVVRTWAVEDVTIPMPFNVGASEFSAKNYWQSSDSLAEPMFAQRKHQAFRPVGSSSVFSPNIYGSGGTLARSQFTNSRLVGRSAWNSRWKLVIPGSTLLNNPEDGIDRFLRCVKDIRLHFVTYSYSGN